MGKKVEICIEEGHLYIDGKPENSIYQVADNTYIITTLPERCKIIKRDNLAEIKRLEKEG